MGEKCKNEARVGHPAGAGGLIQSSTYIERSAEGTTALQQLVFFGTACNDSVLPPSPNSDPGSQQALLPPPHYGSCLHFYREKTSTLASLVDSRRIAPTHARPSQQ